MSALEDLERAMQVIENSKKVVICHPSDAESLRAALRDNPEVQAFFEIRESTALVEKGAAYIVPRVNIELFGDPAPMELPVRPEVRWG